MGSETMKSIPSPFRFPALLGLGLLSLGLSPGQALQAATPPNVIVILTDDQGWGDLSLHGNRNLQTPRIDSLARDGAAFENFYVCAVCSPTRAEFLTGRYHLRVGVSGVSTGQERLEPGEWTLANAFQAAGYATGAFGKWHNGTQTPYHPNDRGFDEFYGFTSGHWGHYFSPPLDHNGQKVRGEGFVVDDFTNHAIDFIRKQRNHPFFCYLPYNTPHSPMMVDDRFYDKFRDLEPSMRHRDPEKEDLEMTRAALAMVENIDWNVGRILDCLKELQLEENTMVFFFCDNGPNSWRWNGGMKGRKGSVDEGGVRSPLLVRWPGRIRPGSHIQSVSGAIDLLPTITGLAGIEPGSSRPLDGRSLAPMLLGQVDSLPSRLLFSTWGKKASVRSDRFRLDEAGQLFDIQSDRGQLKDVAQEHPAEARQLQAALKEHVQEMQALAKRFQDRPFTVGYGAGTTLPARDGEPHGTVERSAKAPNNSFFQHWTQTTDSVTWDVEVGQEADYEITVYYTCGAENVGATVQLVVDETETSVKTQVTQAFDPPLYDKSKERVSDSHYYVKDFAPLKLGTLHLKPGRQTLRLQVPHLTGPQGIDVHSLQLVRPN